MPSVTPADVLAERRRLTLSRDGDGLAELYAPDAVIESPFAPPGTPARLDDLCQGVTCVHKTRVSMIIV